AIPTLGQFLDQNRRGDDREDRSMPDGSERGLSPEQNQKGFHKTFLRQQNPGDRKPCKEQQLELEHVLPAKLGRLELLHRVQYKTRLEIAGDVHVEPVSVRIQQGGEGTDSRESGIPF